MEIALWCVGAVIVMPYLLVLMARLPDLTLEKNLIPRIVSGTFSGYRQRLFWAHSNGLEIIAPFAAAVIIAQNLQVNQQTIDSLAVAFVSFRIVYSAMYIANLGLLRTLMFGGGMACIAGLFIAAGSV